MENTDGFSEHYMCDTVLYLMLMLSQSFSVIIDCGKSAPVHVREVVYGLNVIYKRFIFQLFSTVQLPGENFMTHNWLCTL